MSQSFFSVDDSTECMVGWDPRLETFFGQVYKMDEEGERIHETEDGQDGTILWVGTKPAEIRTVDELVRKFKPYTIPEEILDELRVIECD